MSVSIWAAWKLRELERTRLEERFSRAVQTDLGFIGAVVQQHESALFSLRVKFNSKARVSREEFRFAVNELTRVTTNFSALEWVPRVPESEIGRLVSEARADGFSEFKVFAANPPKTQKTETIVGEHWPIFYVEPVAGNERALGYDLTTGPTVQDIVVARDSGDTRISGPIELRQETRGRKSLVAILPVYDPDLPTETVEQRRRAFRGVVQAVSRIGDIFSEVFAGRSEVPYDLAVFLTGENSADVELVYFRPAREQEDVHPPGMPAAGDFVENKVETIGQRVWAFNFRATPEWLRHNASETPSLVLLLGVVSTVGLCGFLISTTRRTRTIERQVLRRTSELRESNARLEQEANERRHAEASLRRSEQSLAEAQRIARLGRWESVPGTGELAWSPETYRIFGVSPGSFQPTIERFYDCVHPEDRQQVRQQVQAALELGMSYRLVHRILRPDGEIRHVEENAELVPAPEGGDRRLLGTVMDVTERHLAELALASERNLLRTLLDAIPDLIVVKDGQLRYTLVNQANAQHLGVTDPRDAAGRCDADFQPPDQAGRQREDDLAVLRTGNAIFNREEQIRAGAKEWFLTNKVPLRDERGQVNGLICISRDITDRRRMLEDLEREHSLLRTFIDAVPDFIYVKDVAGRYLLTNRANLRLLGGRAMEDVIGRTIHDLFPPEHARLYEEDDRKVLEQGEMVVDHELPMRFPGGREGWVLTTKVPIRDQAGRITAVFGVSRDITESRRLQLERAEMDRRINQSQKLESLGALAGGVAHDFNNILTIVLNNATLAKNFAHDPVLFDECLGQIEHAAARAAHLCNQMLAYSGRGQFVIQPIRLADLVEDTMPLLRSGVSRKAVLEVEAQPAPAVAQADVTQIRQIILNLVINASDALGEQVGTIRILTGMMRADDAYLADTVLTPEVEPGDYVFLEVADSGCGMSPQTVAKIFEPFFTTKFAGRGLGLAAVLGIVRGHRGAIRVQSVVGKGTTIRLLLPAVMGVDPKPLPGPRRGTPSARPASGRILVVDDEDFIRSVVCRALERAGYSTKAAASGQEAVEILARGPSEVAAVLLDLTMPRMDGQQTFIELRKLNPRVPVLLMSGFSESEATARFAGQGLAGFIQKPFEAGALLTQLQEVIGSGQA